MCGIAGFHLLDPGLLDVELRARRLGEMASALHHRGPDDRGIELHGRTGLAFARLSIIDIEGGHQPMLSPDGRYAMVFNGEIYNFRELRAELEREGRRFTTRSDSEVLLAMFERHGERMFPRINGMFGLAIHDRQEETLLLARDRLGIKPLFYRATRGAFLFGSEIKAILAAGLEPPEIDVQGFLEYLSYGFACAPRTIYADVRALRPGHLLRFRRGELQEQAYWSVHRDDTPSARTMEEAADRLGDLLADSVRLRTVADVPLGALLSGGIDSGLVVAQLARQSSRPVKTFSVGFDEERYNELPWAKRVAEMYATDHTEIVCKPDIRPLVERLAVAFDQPFGDSSAVPTYLVSEEARRHVTVALSGDGGDEVFAGYKRHTLLRAHGAAGLPLRRLARTLGSLVPRGMRGAQRLRRMGLSERELQADSLVLVDDRLRARLIGPRASSLFGFRAASAALAAGGPFEAEGGVRRFQHQDLSLYLPNDILEKVDRASMLNSLELRVPLLDHRIVEFGLNLPPELKNDGIDGKRVLRELARRDLPAGHLQKPKTGFAIPASAWLRHELRDLLEDATQRSRLAEAGWFDQDGIRTLKDEHFAGRNASSQLWLLLMAELWFRNASARGLVA